MTVGELMTNIIKMLEEDRIKVTDDVEIELEHNQTTTGGNAHELLTRLDSHCETKLTIRS